jgi:DNA-binding Lrp family transcriptional regulator
MELSETDRRLIAAVQGGLPLDCHPFARVAEQAGVSEQEAISRLDALMRLGLIKRFGIVVRHHELGYRANAMTVWDIPDHQVDEVGRRMAEVPCVTLCYRRPRRPPEWPFNLFAMVHGRDRAVVEQQVAMMAERLGIAALPRRLLFSGRRFKQRGARYVDAAA